MKTHILRMRLLLSVRISWLMALFPGPFVVCAQVPAHEEPYHRPVFQDEYIRILDVQLVPGDTSRMHSHATPSLFIQLSDTRIASQVKGRAWVLEQSVTGKAWFRSFSGDTFIHRVAALGPKPFHVLDIELLKALEGKPRRTKRLRYPIQVDTVAATIYSLTSKDLDRRPVRTKSPLVIVAVSGDGLTYTDRATNRFVALRPGTFHYVPRKTAFYLTAKGKAEATAKIFQVK